MPINGGVLGHFFACTESMAAAQPRYFQQIIITPLMEMARGIVDRAEEAGAKL